MIRQFEVRILWDGQADDALCISNFEIDASRYEMSDVAVISCVLRSQNSQWYQSDVVRSPWLILQMRDLNVSGDWNNIFEGRVDRIRRSHKKNTIEFECRDALSALIDLRIQDSWMNYTGCDLIQVMAQKAGLGVEIEFPSALEDRMCGQFWQVEHKRNLFLSQHRFQTAADIIFDIARDMSCDVYTNGQKIIFTPIRAVPQRASEVFDVQNTVYEGVFSSDISLSQGIIVYVASWDSRQRVSTHIYYDGHSFVQGIPDHKSTIYSFRIPGKRLEDLKRIAQAKYNRLISHAVSSEVTIPGVIGLSPRKFVSILTEGETSYLSIEHVTSHFSIQNGFVQNITMRKRVA